MLNISTFLELKDKLSPGLDRVAANFGKVSNAASQMKSGVATAQAGLGRLTGALASVAAVTGVGLSTKALLDLGSQFEDTALSIAGNIKAFDLAPTFDEARRSATGALGTINTLAAKLPGEAEDYVQVFRTALPKAIESGMGSVREIADFTSRYTAVAISNQIDAFQAASDLALMLGGQAGMEVRTWRTLYPHLKVTQDLLKKMGPSARNVALGTTLTAQQFNRLDATTRRMLVQDAIGKFGDSIGAASNTFSAKMGEMTSRVRELIRVGSEPLFEGAKASLDEINKALERNRSELIRISRDGSAAMASAIDVGVKGTTTILDNFGMLSETAVGIGALVAAWKIVPSAFAIEGTLAAGFAAFSAGTLTLIAGLGFAFSQAMKGAWESMGVADEVYDFLGGFRTSRERELQSEVESQGAISAGNFRAMLLKQYSGMDKAAAAASLGARLQREKGEAVREDFLLVAKQLGLKLPTAQGKPTTPAPNYDFRNSRFNITQEFAEGFDPDRIAVAFASDLARVGEMRVQSALVPAIGSVR